MPIDTFQLHIICDHYPASVNVIVVGVGTVVAIATLAATLFSS